MKKELLKYTKEKLNVNPEDVEYLQVLDKESNCYQISAIGFKIGDDYQVVIHTVLLDAIEPIWNTLRLSGLPHLDLSKFVEQYKKINQNVKN